jgi:lipoteichoic acid synthase
MLAMTREMLQLLQHRFTSGKVGVMAKGVLILHLLVFPALSGYCAKQAVPDSSVQEIRYVTPFASEVYLVWGVNNWNIVNEANAPHDSFVKDNLMYSPMTPIEGGLSASIKVKTGTMLDYVFWITKGPRNAGTDLWDKNVQGQDYHTYVAHDNAVLVEPAIAIKPTQPLTLLDFALPLFLITILWLGLFVFIRRKFLTSINRGPGLLTYALAIAISLFVLLVALRPSVAGSSWDLYMNPANSFEEILKHSYYDFLFVLVFALLFLVPLYFLRNMRKTRITVFTVFAFLSLVALIAGILNIKVVEMLGKPFNYQWLYYSDFMRSPDSQAALSANVSGDYIFRIILLCTTAAAFTILMAGLLNQVFIRKWPQRVVLSLMMICTAVYLIRGYKISDRANIDYDRLSNPVTAFLESVNPFAPHPSLFTMDVADSLRFVPRGKPVEVSLEKNKQIRNVIVFVLESTPAEYIQVYGSKFKATPELAKYASNALIFENLYAHAPATNLSMVSLLGSIYPWLSYNSLTEEHPDMDIKTISSELKHYGYRAGFFNSADNRFQRADEFLAHRKFDAITDCQGEGCGSKKFELNTDWEFMNGKDDACTKEEMMSWIRTDKDRPFFAMMWTYQTHYPYFFEGKEKDYKTGDASLNKYLNALNHSDEVFGQMMSQLKKEKLLESTLVVVVGDHGEAFGRHGQISHGRMIYEENLHVPCMMINPAFKNTKNAEVAGMVDVAPTIMNVLGLEQPQEWQGESLLAEKQNKRAYFFAPWSDFLFGYREGNQKYIYNATKNITEIYDLSEDPEEQENLASFLPGEIDLCHQRLAAWAQYVNTYMLKTLTTPDKKQLAKK